MDIIKVLVVEDKMIVASSITSILEKHGLTVTAVCTSGEDAIKEFIKRLPDLVLMDIELTGSLDGIATAELMLKHASVPIVYLTDYVDPKTVERAKKTLPANYLAKPFHEADLIRAIDIAFTNYKATRSLKKDSLLNDFIFIRTDNQVYQKVAYSDILYLRAERAYCQIVTEDKTLLLSTSMNHIEEQLNHKDFMKVHRSYVVNTRKITSIEGRVIHIGEHQVQMNEESHQVLLKHLKLIK